jgi:hypothetical protein
LFTAAIIVCFALNRLMFGLLYGFERSGLEDCCLPAGSFAALGRAISHPDAADAAKLACKACHVRAKVEKRLA